MGYILPVNHYQYQDYQIRTTQQERSPFAIEKVVKASLDSKFRHGQCREQDRLDYQRISGIYTSKHFHAAAKSSPLNRKEIEKLYSKLTGKGLNFSETV
ncbi:hypothetical protein [Halobacillus litoralis]|uniref:hypothetical protein n=1 Tax=Halobacillus litoralis TaxID=45668 RepID=UPI001CFC679B|nr:hypothetical protein [Halobacillus litoralis]